MTSIRSKLIEKFSVFPPILYGGKDLCIAEIKPYLQPFEKKLAIRELKSFLQNDDINWDEQFATFQFDNIDLLIDKLSYWQRVGKDELLPTKQVLKELSQNGINELVNKESLHKARRLRFGVHNTHEYRGKFFPQLVKSLLNISKIDKNSIVIDPMCGSGTTLVESMDLGFSTIGADLNPLSILVSEVKCSLYSLKLNKLKNLKNEIESYLVDDEILPKSFWDEKDDEYMRNWFNASCLEDIKNIMGCIDTYKGSIRKFLLICLSNILRRVSHQKEDDLRVRKEEKVYISGTAPNLFISELDSNIDRILAFRAVSDVNNKTFDIYQCNIKDLPKVAAKYKGKAGALITSPPYATALPYIDTDRLSLVALNLLRRSEHKKIESTMIGTREISEKQRRLTWEEYCSKKSLLPESINEVIHTIAKVNHQEGVGFRRRNLPALLGKYFLEMLDAMSSARLMIKPKAPGYYIIGNNSTMLDGNKFVINTPELLSQLAEVAGWKFNSMTNMELISSKDVFRANRGSEEVILEISNK